MQLGLNLDRGSWGGRRSGSGRKRVRSKGVAHRTRERVQGRLPLHVNFKFRSSVKTKANLKLLKKAIHNARSHGLRVIHFSLQSNHVHLILEAPDNTVLSRGMRSLTVTFAKGLRKGRVQIERYHLHVLRSIRETKNAIHYVLFNQQRHERGIYSRVDEYSSLLSVERCLELIQKYTRKNRIVIKVSPGERHALDSGLSFLCQRGMAQLFC